MKSIFVAIALLIASLTSAQALEPCTTGSYYNPATTGTGVELQVSEDLIVVYRYGYLGGHADYWVGNTVNDASGAWVIDASQTYQVEPGKVGQAVIGSMTLIDLGDGTFQFDWNWDVDLGKLNGGGSIPWCLNELCNGSEVITPLFQPTICE